jgi:NAD(P)-dependent dehydrogenase (short-subunit alcohol dehydrogenase family)
LVELPVENVDLKVFEQVHGVNAKGTLHFTSEIIKVMAKQDEKFVEGRNGRRSIGRGAVVNIASLAAPVAVPTHVQYCASKAAALSITRVAGKHHGIRAMLHFLLKYAQLPRTHERAFESIACAQAGLIHQ